MIRIVPVLALLGAATALQAQQPAPLSLEHRMSLRCSAAFALVAHGQETGDAQALAYPQLGGEAREYFVRAAAQVMDEAGLDEEGIRAALAAEARDLVDQGSIAPIMQVCLPQLGLPGGLPPR
ncbi:hypothetical protein [Aurantiacibacter suaedae]|uniref:hypothetical protein n=1 Tax=Aurantiacibacter suaedae TaxID=2545755 RepID=UPI0019D53E33|nr:hypothetical protein [Aurantiacibacter suaedae]